jgi:exocyst complex protein 7
MHAEETPASLNHFPEAVSSELICIADWLIMHNRDEYMNVYARVRATILLKSLQQLKEQQRSSSGGSVQGLPVANSPMVVSFIVFTGRNSSYSSGAYSWSLGLFPQG